jgi:hypothetical protein
MLSFRDGRRSERYVPEEMLGRFSQLLDSHPAPRLEQWTANNHLYDLCWLSMIKGKFGKRL